MSATGFLRPADITPAVQVLFDEDVADPGYVMNVSRLWANQPEEMISLLSLAKQMSLPGELSKRERTVLLAAALSALGDSYCTLVWGSRLALASDADTAAGVIRGNDEGLDANEQALARWARRVARDPSAISEQDVQALRDAGYDDSRIFAITAFVGLRLAFAIINGALGVLPDADLRKSAPGPVLDAVTFGRSIEPAS
ncbi:carboxymuconolactone decarboxylase family protein [Kribbella catacumbae]|uniref:carboxymuconolactone decarboxylase family protein n=1 Tax=Kribbella catacumbae TaxID=460086 RepID=UPI000475B111|nr:hypothetical protein [Kribbella catacumbae]